MRGASPAALALCVALLIVPSASAKGRISVRLGDGTPRVGQTFTVYVRTGYVVPAEDWLRLIAVAPGKDWYQVVGVVTGDSKQARASIPRDGFGSLSGVQASSPGVPR